MNATGQRELRQLRRDASDVLRAIGETLFYRRIILDPPTRNGWQTRFRILLPVKKAKR